MVYVFVLFFVVTNLYLVDKFLNTRNIATFFISVLPSLFMLAVFPAIQYGVGVDYFSYRNNYWEHEELDRFYGRSEYLIYYIYQGIINLHLGDQFIFVFASVFNMTALMLLLFRLKNKGYEIWFLFFCFFVVTNIYHNQMNGLRQYLALMLFPFIFLALVEKRYLKALLIFLAACMFHKTAFIAIVMWPMMSISKLSRKSQFYLFLSLPLILAFTGGFFSYLIDTYLVTYRHYLNHEYGKGLPISSIYSKAYYIPLFVYFWFIYKKMDVVKIHWGMKQAIAIWVSTYWLYILYLDFGFMFRISSYFVFFNIFPLYLVWKYLAVEKRIVSMFLLLIYLLMPYLAKVTVLSRGVFEYHSILS